MLWCRCYRQSRGLSVLQTNAVSGILPLTLIATTYSSRSPATPRHTWTTPDGFANRTPSNRPPTNGLGHYGAEDTSGRQPITTPAAMVWPTGIDAQTARTAVTGMTTHKNSLLEGLGLKLVSNTMPSTGGKGKEPAQPGGGCFPGSTGKICDVN